MAGHSQGGWVAQIAAAKNPSIAFIINFAGPTMSVYDQTLLNDEQFYQCEGLNEKQKKKKRRLKKIELGLGKAVGPIIGGEAGHWAKLSRHKTDKVLPKIQVPTLFLFGQHDVYVPAKENIAYLNNLFPQGIPSYFEVYTQEGIDHSFHEVDRPCLDWTMTASNPYSTQLRDFLTKWILSKTNQSMSSQHR
jgi:pimeloyl-ACP methyl ester carboxylesterase